jgi:(2Fe-2S) ferredoxin
MTNLRAKIKAIIYHDVDVDRVMKIVTEAHTEAMNKWVDNLKDWVENNPNRIVRSDGVWLKQKDLLAELAKLKRG